MDFAPAESHEAVASVAADVLGQDAAPPTAQPRSAQPPPAAQTAEDMPYDTALWSKLAAAGLLSIAVPAWLGGDELGLLDVSAVLTEVGRRAAAVPALATLALGVLPVARWGDRDLQKALLTGVADGDTVLTAGLREPSDPMPARPAATAWLGEGPGAVSGVKLGVPYAAQAHWLLVPASIAAGGTGVVIVDRSADGVSLTRTHSSGTAPEYTLRLDEAPVSYVLGGSDGAAVTGLYQLAIAGACCVADGALAAALSLTTEHVRSRQQFGRPLATFQAVAQQIADVYIAARTLHLAVLSACWRLDTGRDAGPDLDVAAYWLAAQAPAALRTCHHLHGGLGMDLSYPLHRFSSLIRDLVRFAGGADYRLDRLGAGIGE